MRRVAFGLLLLMVVFSAVGTLFYLLPRSTGDRFVHDLLRLEAGALQSHLCPDTSLAQITGILSAGGEIGSLLAQVGSNIPGRDLIARTLVPEAAYYPFTGAYVFRLTIGQQVEIADFKLEAGVNAPEMSLQIGRRDLLTPCVYAG